MLTEEQRLIRTKVLEETALAYLRKKDRVQYCARNLTYWNRYDGGPRRRNDGAAPEYAPKDSYLFTVCSSFIYNCLYNAFGYELCGSDVKHTCNAIRDSYRDYVTYCYEKDVPAPPGDGKPSVSNAIKTTLETIRPGDILVTKRSERSLHVMLCLSGGRLIHSSGNRLNMVTGKENWDSPGSIRINDMREYLLNADGYNLQSATDWYVIDILSAIDPEKYPIQPWARRRLDYPGLDIDRITSVRAGQTVQPGDAVTVTIQLENTNPRYPKNVYRDLTVEEVLPEHTTLLPTALTADTVLDGNKLRWTMSLAQGEERIIQYSFRIDDDVKPGTVIVSGGGNVGGIPSNEFRLTVGASHLDVETCRKLQALAGKMDGAVKHGDGMAQWIYEQIGKPVSFPTVADLIEGLYEFYDVENCLEDGLPKEDGETHAVLKHRADPDPAMAEAMKMMAPKLIGGTMLACVERDDRVLEFRGENLHPGDVILVARDLDRGVCKPEQWVILGGGKAAVTTEEKTEVIDLPYMDVMLVTKFFVVLRPSVLR